MDNAGIFHTGHNQSEMRLHLTWWDHARLLGWQSEFTARIQQSILFAYSCYNWQWTMTTRSEFVSASEFTSTSCLCLTFPLTHKFPSKLLPDSVLGEHIWIFLGACLQTRKGMLSVVHTLFSSTISHAWILSQLPTLMYFWISACAKAGFYKSFQDWWH